MTTLHPIQRRFLAEELVRLRRSDEQRRYVASQRTGRVDPNPHQIDAVIFALRRLREGGCILADEVGLGKTIEAGLVMAQLMAEGARRVLLVTPKPLLGQWRQELFTLFGIEAREGSVAPGAFDGVGTFLAGRELVGSERGEAALRSSARFDLCVVDEAHEVFAAIHKRFGAQGEYREESPHARMAARLRNVLAGSGTPVLLLTATPIQNSLAELWGLVQYVDPSGTLLGELHTFRATFCDGRDQLLVEGQEHELRRRLATVCRRTLRRQAQEFMKQPFVERRAQLFEYPMSPEERALYDDVTAYLLEPGICAFRGNQRRLLLILFHRRMASSLPALSASLDKVAERLQRTLDDGRAPVADDAASSFGADLEDDDDDEDEQDDRLDDAGSEDAAAPEPARVRAELDRVLGFAVRARALPSDGKAQALVRAVRVVAERGRAGTGSGKLVVFTESVTTQDYLRRLLVESHLVADDEVTLFRGDNGSARANAALARWTDEVGSKQPRHGRPSRDVAIRLALVHEFATRSRVFISTEAGAKGLNLQFCETLVNYDLPWNPQRIEQRIGRCHRYGQKRGVTVINFIAKDNEAQRLTFEILSQKLELFGTVLDASDVVLHQPGNTPAETLAGAFGAEFESRLRRIYERARTQQEVEQELRELRETIDGRRKSFEETHRRTAGLIESHLDDSVRRSFRRLQDELPAGLAELDHDLGSVLAAYLDAIGARHERTSTGRGACFVIGASDALPPGYREGVRVSAGEAGEGEEALHLAHPLVLAAVEEARDGPARFSVAIRAGVTGLGATMTPGRRGKLALLKVRHDGFEPVERLLPVVLVEGSPSAVSPEVARELMQAPIEDLPAAQPPVSITEEDLSEAIEEALFLDEAAVSTPETGLFEHALEQVERFVDDRALIVRRRRDALAARMGEVESKRDGAVGADARSAADETLRKLQGQLDALEVELERLRDRNDDAYRRCRESALQRRYGPPRIERLVEADWVMW